MAKKAVKVGVSEAVLKAVDCVKVNVKWIKLNEMLLIVSEHCPREPEDRG
jgi:hypothetical protein